MDGQKLLKRDLFGEVAISFADGGPVIMRNAAASRWWTRWIARYLLRREARALAMLEGVKGIPALVCHDRDMLVRSFLEGEPLYVARPDRKGKPKDVFMEDGLHLDEEGYRLWQEALVPFLDAISLDELAAIPLPTRQEPRS